MEQPKPMRTLNLTLLSCVLLSRSLTAHCQDKDVPSLSTDRPSIGSGASLVPAGYLQTESGITWSRAGTDTTVDGTETLLRLGVSKRFEAQLAAPNMHWVVNDGRLPYSDFSFALKWAAVPDGRPWPLAVVGSVSLPVGSQELSSGGIDPAVLLATGHTFAHGIQLSSSVSLALSSQQEAARFWNSQFALSLGKNAGPRAGFFVEAAPYGSTVAQSSSLSVDGGMTWAVSNRLQLDWRTGAALQQSGTAFFASIGYSTRRRSW